MSIIVVLNFCILPCNDNENISTYLCSKCMCQILIIYVYFFQTNTFQLFLATDGTNSFAFFLYLDDGIQWTTGNNGGGINGLGGMEAQVGYDAGNDINYYTVPGSMTPNVVDIETTSNVGIPGLYLFDVATTYLGKSRHNRKCICI